MTALKLWALVVLLHTSSANLYCDNILQLSAEVNELKKVLKNSVMERIELQRKVERLSTNRSAVAFTVTFENFDTNNGISLGHGQTLKFDKVITNIGGGYDYRTGIFSAPFAGVYVFFLTLMSSNTRGYVHLVIDRHGTVLDAVFAEGSSDPYDQGSTQVTTHLATGEQTITWRCCTRRAMDSLYWLFDIYGLKLRNIIRHRLCGFFKPALNQDTYAY